MSDDTKALISAYLLDCRLGEQAAYLNRGRAYSTQSDAELGRRWAVEFNRSVAAGEGSSAEANDLGSELDCRDLPLPIELVQAALDLLDQRIAAARAAGELDSEGLIDDLDDYIARRDRAN